MLTTLMDKVYNMQNERYKFRRMKDINLEGWQL